MSIPDQRRSFVVFAQSESAVVDVAAWDAHAQRFFRTRLSLAQESSPDGAQGAGLLVAPSGEPAGIRHVQARPRDGEDLVLAERADVAHTGLALLARRCPTVWLVGRETESDDDPLALRLAAILASVLLGPILDARIPELLGVKSARARFERSQTARS
jgi:hypothetical protein